MAARKELTINLQGKVPGGAGFEFLELKLCPELSTYFGRVLYSVDGKKQDKAFRFDLGKGIFLDQFDDLERQNVLLHAAPMVMAAAQAAYAATHGFTTPDTRSDSDRLEAMVEQRVASLMAEQERLQEKVMLQSKIIDQLVQRLQNSEPHAGQSATSARKHTYQAKTEKTPELVRE